MANTWRGIDPIKFGLDRIVIDPEINHGQPTVKGTRIMVAWVLQSLRSLGKTIKGDDIHAVYPSITDKDIDQCLLFAFYLCEWGDDSHE